MLRCFVIQPFDQGGAFDKRFSDVFSPAIEAASMEPYRVDRDPSVRIPIDDIMQNIQESAICFAEITTNNPNVWFELGVAFQAKKNVILVCSSERKDEYPFDVRHRAIIQYKTESKSDYSTLQKQITAKIDAFKKMAKGIEKIRRQPVIKETKGLSEHEMTALTIIASEDPSRETALSVLALKNAMERTGFTPIAVTLSLEKLRDSGLVETETKEDEQGYEYPAVRTTAKGIQWLMENQEKLVLQNVPESTSGDIPF